MQPVPRTTSGNGAAAMIDTARIRRLAETDFLDGDTVEAMCAEIDRLRAICNGLEADIAYGCMGCRILEDALK